jgi:hypothetical protein
MRVDGPGPNRLLHRAAARVLLPWSDAMLRIRKINMLRLGHRVRKPETLRY